MQGSMLDRMETFITNYATLLSILLIWFMATLGSFMYGFRFEVDAHYTDLRRFISPIGRGCGIVLVQ